MTINYYLDNRSNNTEKCIILYLRGLGKTLKFNTAEKINPKHWNSTKQSVKRTYTGHPELNSYLNTLKEKVKRNLRLLNVENDLVTFDMVKDQVNNILKFQKPVDSNKAFYKAFDQFLLVRENESRHRTIQKFNTLLDHLKNFEKKNNYKLSFDKFNLQFYEKFTAYLVKDLKHSNNTVGKYISSLKTFLRWTVERGLNTHLDFTKYKVPNEKADIIVLSENEFMKLYTLDLSDNKSLAKVRDVFCFQCLTGQRFSDIESLKREDIKDNSWYLHTYKTKDIIEIPLTPLAKEILKRYISSPQPLPVISQQKTNDYLKELCALAEINDTITQVRYRGNERIEVKKRKYEFITTHTARRTFVTISLEKGMKPETIMEITGHTNYKTFRKYVKITSKVKHLEMNKFWKKPAHLKLIKNA
ncbi:site-specific integrase [Bacteroidota bacterium]